MQGAVRMIGMALAALLLSACETRPVACGEYPEGGGPAVIRTRDQEACELVRQRVLQELAATEDLTFERAATLLEKSDGWQHVDDVGDLLRRVERDAGPGFAAAVRRGIESVLGASGRPLSADCGEDQERCIARGAAKGARLALVQGDVYVRGGRPSSDTAPRGRSEGIDLEKLRD